MKTQDEYFLDWENYVFGYGYGSGEYAVLELLMKFLDTLKPTDYGTWSYHHKELEDVLGVGVAWLLINTLCHADILEYGTSPRNGWLTEQGRSLKEYLRVKTLDEAVKVATNFDTNSIHCSPDYCNCDEKEADCKKDNPFW